MSTITIMNKPLFPTVDEQKEFAQKFHPEEWLVCCNSAFFLKAVEEDLARAEICATKILGDLWDMENDCSLS